LYNTYKCEGLPAGPITNPGLAAIEVALYPAETDYYYFVTDSDWNYYYSSTYAQHSAKCRELGLM
ncbi:MAG: endolytic transglycosylase MltG, partial [Clostridia bacterium]|nr:endolytic transglycosylase MltG [Clostridia bacterium]